MFFAKHYLPTDPFIDWSLRTYVWIIENFGGWREFGKRRLILPTKDFYPPTNKSGHDLAAFYFGLTKRYAGLAKWPCRLRSAEEDADPAMLYGGVSRGVAGTFSSSWSGDEALVLYSPRNLGDPASLMATFAHELSHYFLRSAPTDPPRGSFADEPATDVGAVYLGFGVFLANSAFTYINRSGRALKQGYLDEKQLSYALAIFCALKNIPLDGVQKYLKTNPKAYVKAACRDLENRWGSQLDAVRGAWATRLWP